jgi:putative transposase
MGRQNLPKPSQDLESATDVGWAVAVERERLIASLAAERHVRVRDADAAAVALDLTRTMIYRLVARYRRDPRTSSLLSETRGRKKGSIVLDNQVTTVIERSIKVFYLKPERPSIADLHRFIETECRKSGLKQPSYKAVRARIKALDPEETIRRRFGPRAARDQFCPVSAKGLRPTRPLELYQIDHTLVDVIVVDEVDRRPIGRPWLTVVIDVATRMIAGYYLSFDHPSSTSVALALSHAVLPKDKYLRRFELNTEWPVMGLPARVHLDNAEEFHARALERGCQEYGIALDYRPPLRPHFGGHIERLVGTLMKAMHLLPGTTFSSAKHRADYDSEGKAAMTIIELETWLALQVTGAYHGGFHRGLGTTPIEAWMRGHSQTNIRQPDDPERFYINFLPFERRLIRRDGIQLNRIHYWDDALSAVAGRSNSPAMVRYDPRDLSKIFVKDSSRGGYIAIPYRDLSHPPITLMEQRAAMRALARNKQQAITEGTVFATINTQRAIVQLARQKTLTARRKLAKAKVVSPETKPNPKAIQFNEDDIRSDEAVQPYETEIWDE